MALPGEALWLLRFLRRGGLVCRSVRDCRSVFLFRVKIILLFFHVRARFFFSADVLTEKREKKQKAGGQKEKAGCISRSFVSVHPGRRRSFRSVFCICPVAVSAGCRVLCLVIPCASPSFVIVVVVVVFYFWWPLKGGQRKRHAFENIPCLLYFVVVGLCLLARSQNSCCSRCIVACSYRSDANR